MKGIEIDARTLLELLILPFLTYPLHFFVTFAWLQPCFVHWWSSHQVVENGQMQESIDFWGIGSRQSAVSSLKRLGGRGRAPSFDSKLFQQGQAPLFALYKGQHCLESLLYLPATWLSRFLFIFLLSFIGWSNFLTFFKIKFNKSNSFQTNMQFTKLTPAFILLAALASAAPIPSVVSTNISSHLFALSNILKVKMNFSLISVRNHKSKWKLAWRVLKS